MSGHNATLENLHGWTKRSFEKLGWMILALKDQNFLKVKAYLANLDDLKASLIKNRELYEENDRKRDIDVLLDRVNTLIDFINTNIDALPKAAASAFGKRR